MCLVDVELRMSLKEQTVGYEDTKGISLFPFDRGGDNKTRDATPTWVSNAHIYNYGVYCS